MSMINKTASGDTVQQSDTENQEGSDTVQRQDKERRRPQTTVPRPRSSPRTSSTSRLAVPRISQEVMRNAIEVCQTGMVLVDHTGVIVLVNVEVERLFGYTRSELIGQPIDMLLPANLRNQHASHRKAYTAHPKTCMGPGRVLSGLHQDGSLLDMEVGLNAIDTREGLLVLCAITDVRERKRRERLKDEFVATVSHELRTPVTSISASIGLLCGNAAGPLPGAAESLLRIAYKNCQRLGQLLNDILDIDKLQSGKVAFNSARIEVRGLVEEAVEANTSSGGPCWRSTSIGGRFGSWRDFRGPRTIDEGCDKFTFECDQVLAAGRRSDSLYGERLGDRSHLGARPWLWNSERFQALCF